jgi:hypothetical protein
MRTRAWPRATAAFLGTLARDCEGEQVLIIVHGLV